MIHLNNGHSFEFASASGALGLDGYDGGNGIVRAWKWPFRTLGWLRPRDFTVITKSLTRHPRAGNLRLLTPWRCFRPLRGGGTVNAIGFTNPGIDDWILTWWPRARGRFPLIVSIAPETAQEANEMAWRIQRVDRNQLVGIELNVSCPNVVHDRRTAHVQDLVRAIQEETGMPLLVKLGADSPYHEICTQLDGAVAAFDLINAVPWTVLFGGSTPSPLAPYGLLGGVSGPPIASIARGALDNVRRSGVRTPILAGGGIDSLEEVNLRFELGADAVSFGVAFLRPWLPNRIVRQWRRQPTLS